MDSCCICAAACLWWWVIGRHCWDIFTGHGDRPLGVAWRCLHVGMLQHGGMAWPGATSSLCHAPPARHPTRAVYATLYLPTYLLVNSSHSILSLSYPHTPPATHTALFSLPLPTSTNSRLNWTGTVMGWWLSCILKMDALCYPGRRHGMVAFVFSLHVVVHSLFDLVAPLFTRAAKIALHLPFLGGGMSCGMCGVCHVFAKHFCGTFCGFVLWLWGGWKVWMGQAR